MLSDRCKTGSKTSAPHKKFKELSNLLLFFLYAAYAANQLIRTVLQTEDNTSFSGTHHV